MRTDGRTDGRHEEPPLWSAERLEMCGCSRCTEHLQTLRAEAERADLPTDWMKLGVFVGMGLVMVGTAWALLSLVGGCL